MNMYQKVVVVIGACFLVPVFNLSTSAPQRLVGALVTMGITLLITYALKGKKNNKRETK